MPFQQDYAPQSSEHTDAGSLAPGIGGGYWQAWCGLCNSHDGNEIAFGRAQIDWLGAASLVITGHHNPGIQRMALLRNIFCRTGWGRFNPCTCLPLTLKVSLVAKNFQSRAYLDRHSCNVSGGLASGSKSRSVP